MIKILNSLYEENERLRMKYESITDRVAKLIADFKEFNAKHESCNCEYDENISCDYFIESEDMSEKIILASNWKDETFYEYRDVNKNLITKIEESLDCPKTRKRVPKNLIKRFIPIRSIWRLDKYY